MYKVYTIGRKGGICSLVPREKGATHLCLTREEGATRLCRQRGEKEFGGRRRREEGGIPLCRQRGEKESGRKEDDLETTRILFTIIWGFTSARCTNTLIHTYISVCNDTYYQWGEGRWYIVTTSGGKGDDTYYQWGEGRWYIVTTSGGKGDILIVMERDHRICLWSGWLLVGWLWSVNCLIRR